MFEWIQGELVNSKKDISFFTAVISLCTALVLLVFQTLLQMIQVWAGERRAVRERLLNHDLGKLVKLESDVAEVRRLVELGKGWSHVYYRMNLLFYIASPKRSVQARLYRDHEAYGKALINLQELRKELFRTDDSLTQKSVFGNSEFLEATAEAALKGVKLIRTFRNLILQEHISVWFKLLLSVIPIVILLSYCSNIQ